MRLSIFRLPPALVFFTNVPAIPRVTRTYPVEANNKNQTAVKE
jgi:hypothetical protein